MAARLPSLLFSDSEDELFEFIMSPDRIIRDRSDYFNTLSDKEFRLRFRLSKSVTLRILSEVEDKLEYLTDRNAAVSPINQLLIALRYYATGAFDLTLADLAGVSKATANRCVNKVSHALSSLHEKYIQFPDSDHEIRRTQVMNYSVASFPKVLGFLDCTHIKILSPGGDNAELFRNRKGYFSLNTQVICNANLEILDIVARWPGSAHDSTIFNSCFRNAMFIDGRYGDALLLGDSGYPLRSYLMTPLDSPSSRSEALYNESHIRSRNCIERLFGVWKRRFPVLALGINKKIKNVFAVIIATAVLYNILRQSGEDVFENLDDPDLQLPGSWSDLISLGQIQPQQQTARNDRQGIRTRNCLILNHFHNLR